MIISRRFVSTVRKGYVLGFYDSPYLKKGDILTDDALLALCTPSTRSFLLGNKSLLPVLHAHKESIGKSGNQLSTYATSQKDNEGTESEVLKVSIVGLGERQEDTNLEDLLENTRVAAGNGVRALGQVENVFLDPMSNVHAAAEGAYLGSYKFNKFMTAAKVNTPSIDLYVGSEKTNENSFIDVNGWSFESGKIYAEAQNQARHWMEMPSNHLTPTNFACEAAELLSKCQVEVFDREWINSQNMNAFMAVTRGSEEEPRFVSAVHKGNPSSDEYDVVLVGKGVTFDSGGISIKPSAGMAAMKGDMGGAAVVLSTLKAVSDLNVPLNVAVCVPLCENMPSGKATKPGDIVYASNGKSIEIDNTDAEGRLILADALVYARKTFKSKYTVDVATLTGAMDVALGYAMAGFFSTSDELVSKLSSAGKTTGDHLWNMPLHPQYSKQIKSDVADLRNVGGRGAGACTAASFLKEFAVVDKNDKWAHIDMAGVMQSSSTQGYDIKGMSGRPTRTLIQFINDLTKK
jgi:aminopeptidase